jgi:hypothetical protein
MCEEHLCQNCGKPLEYDKHHSRWNTFCSRECANKYIANTSKVKNENRKCPVCGKTCNYNSKCKKWSKTCGSPDCVKQLQSLGQGKRHICTVKFQITKEELFNLFIVKNMTREDLAKYYNCSLANIKKKLAEYKISKPSRLSNKNTLETKRKIKEALN